MKRRNKAVMMLVALLALTVFANSFSAAPAFKAAGSEDGIERSTDPVTDDTWEEYFSDNIADRTNAGRIWTDKSVRDGNASYTREQKVFAQGGGFITETKNINVNRSSAENFLVNLSALSSYKSIMGIGTVPIDVYFLLDTSASMRTSANRGSITAMVAATNNSLDTIFTLNNNNRAGVIVFDGTSQIALPLDMYDNPTGTPYLTVVNTAVEDQITVRAHAPITGDSVNKTVNLGSGTYTQGALAQALHEFTKLPNSDMNFGNLDERIPIIVLMSDGSPTISVTEYIQTSSAIDANIAPSPNPLPDPYTGDPYIGQLLANGQGTTGITFITQLEAAYAKYKINERYNGKKTLFYTLGYGLENLGGATGVLAETILDPSKSTEELDNYWNKYLNNTLINGTMQVKNTSSWYNLVKGEDKLTEASRNYVDQYYAADSQGQLEDVFNEIMEEIKLQSHVYPTEVSGENADMSGYLNFQDVIGEYMEVKNVNGLLYGSEFFTGAYFAKALMDAYADYTGNNVDLPPPEAEGGSGLEPPTNSTVKALNHVYEFIKSSSERLGISIGDATSLVEHTIENNQIYYNSDSDFGNYVLWYGTGDRYVAPASIGDTAANVPPGATTLNKSYVFFREDAEAGKVGPDIMYIGVRVQTDLASGRQKVIFTVPASMVPVVGYDIVLDTGLDPGADGLNAAVEKISEYPVSLFYEVGLKAGLNETTALDVVADTYQYIGSDGTMSFYTSDWAKDDANTVVHYTPSHENEFYYFIMNTPVYASDGAGGYELLQGGPVSGTTYYYKAQSYTAALVRASTPVQQEYLPLPQSAYSEIVADGAGGFHIRKGTIKLEEEGFALKRGKTSNPTSTYIYAVDLSYVMDDGVYIVRAELGNNSLLRLTQEVVDDETQTPLPTVSQMPSPQERSPQERSPQTGDNSDLALWCLLTLLSLAALSYGAVIKSRKNRRSRQ